MKRYNIGWRYGEKVKAAEEVNLSGIWLYQMGPILDEPLERAYKDTEGVTLSGKRTGEWGK